MKKLGNTMLFLLLAVSIAFTGCSDDYSSSDEGPIELNSKIYELSVSSDSGVMGTVTFLELSDSNVSVKLKLQNTVAGNAHPAHLHVNTAAEGGAIALSLEQVDGATGESTTIFNTLNDGTLITYEDLLDFNGYINIHESVSNLSTIIAQGDIGQNELTGTEVSYILNENMVPGISGTIEFAERVNESTLVTVKLIGTVTGNTHPAHIHENNLATTGNIIVGLTAVNGATGISKTQVATLVGGASVTYTDLLTINAYVNIHLSDADLATIVAEGNIGASLDDNAVPEIKIYSVTNNGSAAYEFNGEGLTNAVNPDFTFKRGSRYVFNVSVSGHPFLINSIQGTGRANMYNDGVTNNGIVNGTITFIVPSDAPDTLYYNCEFHGLMNGVITITD
jgi:Cu/Zn superoxide dismutase